MNRCLAGLALVLCVFQCAHAEVPRELRVCGDANEWPPYDFFLREGQKKTDTVAGFDVDMLNAILEKNGRHASYRLLPWKRCLGLTALGQFDVILDVIKIPARERDFLLSDKLYAVTPVAIFDKARPVPKLETAKDLARLRQCEILGTDNSSYVPGGVVELSRPVSLDAAAGMIKAGRCDMLLFDLEVVRGLRQFSGDDIFDEQDFTWKPLPWIPNINLYFGVSRALPYRDDLLKMLNLGIEELAKSGDVQHLRQRYDLH